MYVTVSCLQAEKTEDEADEGEEPTPETVDGRDSTRQCSDVIHCNIWPNFPPNPHNKHPIAHPWG